MARTQDEFGEGAAPGDPVRHPRESPWSKALDPDRFRAYLEPIEVREGERLIRQGDPADSLFFIASGRMSVELEKGDGTTERLRRLLPGTIIGEMGLYLWGTRTTSVLAEEHCIAYRMSAESLEEMQRREPELAAAFHLQVARLMADRFSTLTRMLEALLR